jgi:MFS family permease
MVGSMVAAAFPAADWGRALGLNAASVYVGLTLGPVIGGLLVGGASWCWIFYVNLRISAKTLLAGWRLLGVERRTPGSTLSRNGSSWRRLDWPGTAAWRSWVQDSPG